MAFSSQLVALTRKGTSNKKHSLKSNKCSMVQKFARCWRSLKAEWFVGNLAYITNKLNWLWDFNWHFSLQLNKSYAFAMSASAVIIHTNQEIHACIETILWKFQIIIKRKWNVLRFFIILTFIFGPQSIKIHFGNDFLNLTKMTACQDFKRCFIPSSIFHKVSWKLWLNILWRLQIV